MEDYLSLPFFSETKNSLFLFRLNERNQLCLNRGKELGVWENEVIIAENCRRFVTAPDKDDVLHVITTDDKQLFHYHQVTQEDIRTLPFIYKENPGAFHFSFLPENVGFFVCSGMEASNLLQTAIYENRWSAEQLTCTEKTPEPVCLSLDQNGGTHVICYDQSSRTLSYLYRPRLSSPWARPCILDPNLGPISQPTLWVDSRQVLHIAWYSPNQKIIFYRKKLPGGWPHGGWQPEHFVSVESEPRFLSFVEAGESLILWFASATHSVTINELQAGDWQQTERETYHKQPVRCGLKGQIFLNMGDSFLPSTWAFTVNSPDDINKTITENSRWEKQEDELIKNARKLMDSKKQLEAILYKKDASLAQYRQMLERSQESFQKQHADWQGQSEKLREKIKKLQNEAAMNESELKTLRESNELHKKNLNLLENEAKKHASEVKSLQIKVDLMNKTEKLFKEKIKQLENELVAKKSVWEKITGIVHKNPPA